MCSLGRFADLPNNGEIPVCVVDGKIQFSSPELLNLQLYTNSVSNHPRVTIHKDALCHPRLYQNTGSMFVQGNNSLLVRLEDAWFESGFGRMLDILDEEATIMKHPARILRMVMKSFHQIIKFTIAPTYEEYNSHVHSERERFPVVSISWHPHVTLIAVATRDDTVTIYSRNSNFNPILKSKSQRRITCIAWRPISLGELAVACSEGVYLWDVDTENIVSRPAVSTAARLLPGSYITSISWSPDGEFLVASNGYSNSITVWKPDEMRKIELKNIGGISYVSWSPDGHKIMACSNNDEIRIWKTSDWTVDQWRTSGGAALHPVWSSDGHVLLFATRRNPCLCCINFSSPTFVASEAQTNVVQAVADLAVISIGEKDSVGGEVTGMAWDPTNQYLAVIFKDSPLVAVFLTRTSSMFTAKPGFFVRGSSEEIPATVAFQNNFAEGANLTICWSSGRLQYFPIVSRNSFGTRQDIVRQGFGGNYRNPISLTGVP